MGNFALDFIKGVASPFEYLAKADLIDPVKEIAGTVSGNQQAEQNATRGSNEELGLGAQGTDIGSGLRTFASNAAQVGLDVAAPGIAKGAEGAVGLDTVKATTVAGKTALGATKGVVAGATIGGAQGVAEGVGSDQPLNAKSLGMDFIQGAEGGAATGGVIGGAAGAYAGIRDGLPAATPLASNEAGSIQLPGKPSDQFSDEDLQKMAQSDDPKEIAKTMEPTTGPIVAQKIAPAIANTDDPAIVKNEIDNELNQHIAPAVPSPAPTPLPPITSVSDINTPQQVAEQGSAAEVQPVPQSDEESLAQSGQQLPPSFMNDPGATPGPSHVSNLAALTGMRDIIANNGTADEALQHYMDTTGSGPEEARNALGQLIREDAPGDVDIGKLNSSLNPQYDKTDFPDATSEDAAKLNSKYANNRVLEMGQKATDALAKLSPEDQELARSLKGRDPELVINKAEDPEQFAQFVSALKDYNDYTQAAGSKLGQPLPYRQNYGLRTPYEAPGATDEPVNPPAAGLPTSAAYTKGRAYLTHEDALADGAKPKFGSAMEDLQNDITNRSRDQSQLALAKGLDQVYPGQVKIINNGSIPAGYRQLLIPNGNKIFLPTDIADNLNAREMAKPTTGLLGKYDQLNAAGKNLELGGGLFHGANTGGIFVGQQLLSGKIFSDPGAASNVVKSLFSTEATKNYMSEIGKEGSFDENHSIVNAADAVGLNFNHVASDIGSPSDKGIVGKISSIPGLKQIHQAIFERQIPTMMLETFRQKTQGLDIFGNADDREQGIKIAKGINNEYGHINRDIQGLTPKQFKLASRAVLAADYQEGQLRTLAKAFDPKSIGTADGRLAREAVFGKALLFGGVAALGGAAGGEFKGDNAKETALAIMNKAVNPSFDIGGYKVGLPATQISNVVKPVEQSVAGAKNGKGIATGVENFAGSHAAFVPSKAEEFGTNKDFSGNPVYGKDYFGRPISAGDVALNAASGIAPIPVAQTAKTAEGNESVGAAVANTAGLNVSPQYNLNYAPVAGQTYIERLEKTPGTTKEQLNADTQFFDLLGQGSKGKTKTIQEAEQAIIAKNPQKANQIISDYNERLIKTFMPWEQGGGTKYLDTTMLQLLKTAQITYKKANENVAYDTKTNPTAYGVPISALATAPQTVGAR